MKTPEKLYEGNIRQKYFLFAIPIIISSLMIYAVSYVIYAYTLFAVLPEEIRIYGVHTAIGLAYITEVIFAAAILFMGKWKSSEYKRLETEYKENISNKTI